MWLPTYFLLSYTLLASAMTVRNRMEQQPFAGGAFLKDNTTRLEFLDEEFKNSKIVPATDSSYNSNGVSYMGVNFKENELCPSSTKEVEHKGFSELNWELDSTTNNQQSVKVNTFGHIENLKTLETSFPTEPAFQITNAKENAIISDPLTSLAPDTTSITQSISTEETKELRKLFRLIYRQQMGGDICNSDWENYISPHYSALGCAGVIDLVVKQYPHKTKELCQFLRAHRVCIYRSVTCDLDEVSFIVSGTHDSDEVSSLLLQTLRLCPPGFMLVGNRCRRKAWR